MRLLHTSDWHLGRTFHGASLLNEQRQVLQAMIDLVREHRVDAVLVAGDIYDRALPHVDAVRLFNWALGQLRATGARIVLSSGNHDSAARLGFAAELLDAADVHVVTDLQRMVQPVVLSATDHQVAIYGVPYLEPRMVMEELEVEEPNHQAVVAAALERVQSAHNDLCAKAAAPVHSVVLAHLFAAGGVGCDSERALSTGNLDVVAADLFAGFDYAALGHLHGKQRLHEHVRYSGSPLAYSFSEARHRKSVLLVETDASGVAGVKELELPVPRALAVLRGQLEQLLADPDLGWAEQAWCQVTLTDAQRPAEAMTRLRERFPDTLVLAFAPEGAETEAHPSYAQRLARAKSTAEVCADFVEHVRERPVDEDEAHIIDDVLKRVREGRVSA
ncbi:exonuclease SbcCD subunit D C-terminal domain-containing protein [Glutamicibacter sp. PS]|uniref:exonuclease SbcCD subunit D n=1 Tax=Glutamicibacter sp. PS TaxID=3075634 RepID=UPI002841821A|nr:exonuclease SbcCD subunit D C-terminal domain-containing protein [Glutamicibacter sp. PS]MDR4533109.1 exonuclease SbcCD subunit D C-terminal domain-containing protein [Glutamicibacter sp. PS]